MSQHSEIGMRMKEFYENIPKIKLYRKIPAIVRLRWLPFSFFHKRF